MPVTFRQLPVSPTDGPHALGDIWAFFGTLAFTGRYLTGGEVLTLPTVSPGLGIVQAAFFTAPAGYVLNWDRTNRRLLLYSAARTQFTNDTTYPVEIVNDVYALFLFQ